MAVDLGDALTLQIEVKDANGALTNAATVVLTVTLPDGTTATPTISNPTIGVYTVNYATTQAGRHLTRWVATNPTVANAGAFDVRPAEPAYIISLEDAKEQLNFTDSDDDEELRGFIESATAVIERHRDEVVARRMIVERRTVPTLRDVLKLRKHPVISLTSVESRVGSTTWNVADLDVDPEIGTIEVLAGPLLQGKLKITYVAGFTVIPANYTKAAAMIVDHLWETQRGQAGATRFVMTEDVTTVQGFNFSVPRKALELLGDPVPTLA